MADNYTKSILTIIAIALSVIAIRGPLGASSASALGEGCGDQKWNPCYVTGSVSIDGTVDVNTNN